MSKQPFCCVYSNLIKSTEVTSMSKTHYYDVTIYLNIQLNIIDYTNIPKNLKQVDIVRI